MKHKSKAFDFHDNVENLLDLLHSDSKNEISATLQSLLAACRKVHEECEDIEDDSDISDDEKDSLMKLKSKFGENYQSFISSMSEYTLNTENSIRIIEQESRKLSMAFSVVTERIKIIKSSYDSTSDSVSVSTQDTLLSTTGIGDLQGKCNFYIQELIASLTDPNVKAAIPPLKQLLILAGEIKDECDEYPKESNLRKAMVSLTQHINILMNSVKDHVAKPSFETSDIVQEQSTKIAKLVSTVLKELSFVKPAEDVNKRNNLSLYSENTDFD
jgi:DNA-binding transcriptional regulator GbsR (MarR family)